MVDIEQIREKLMGVNDPEIGIDIVDLGLVYGIEEIEEGVIQIRMTMTTPGCPAHDMISIGAQLAAQEVEGVAEARVDVVWDPPWSPDMMNDIARTMLRIR